MPSLPFNLENSVLSVAISGSTGRIYSISSNSYGVTVNSSVEQDLRQYYSDTSGPYNFGPLGTSSHPPFLPFSSLSILIILGDAKSLSVDETALPTNYLSEGPLLSELVQVVSLLLDKNIYLHFLIGISM
jgi:hypothetical protein